jgi:hypothetical protein
MSSLSNATREEFSNIRKSLSEIKRIAVDHQATDLIEAVNAAEIAVLNARSASFVN